MSGVSTVTEAGSCNLPEAGLKQLVRERFGNLSYDACLPKFNECETPELMAGLALQYKGSILDALHFLNGCGWDASIRLGAMDILRVLAGR